MRREIMGIVCAAILVGGCGRVDSQSAAWPYSEVYRGLTSLSEDQAKKRAVRECERQLKTTDGVAVTVLPVKEQVDYFRVLVEGKLDDNTVTNSVLIHRFNPKGDKIEEK